MWAADGTDQGFNTTFDTKYQEKLGRELIKVLIHF